MRDWTNYSTEEIISRVFIHGNLMSHQGMPLVKMDESVASIIAEIQKRINNSYNNGYIDGYSDGYRNGYSEGYDNACDDLIYSGNILD